MRAGGRHRGPRDEPLSPPGVNDSLLAGGEGGGGTTSEGAAELLETPAVVGEVRTGCRVGHLPHTAGIRYQTEAR